MNARIMLTAMFAICFSVVSFAQQLRVSGETSPILINDVDAAKIALHPLRQYLPPSSFMVLEISLLDVDAEETMGWIEDHAPSIVQLFGIDATAIDKKNALLRAADATRIFFVASTQIAQHRGPLIVIPSSQPERVAKVIASIADQFPSELKFGTRIEDGLVLAGPEQVLADSQPSLTKEASPLLVRLLRSTELPHRFVFMLPDETREDLAALWPKSIGDDVRIELSPRQVVADLKSMSVHWGLPPQPRIHIEIEGMNDAAVMRLQSELQELVKLTPEPHKLLLLMQDGRLVLDLDAETIAAMINPLPSRDSQ